MSDPVCWSARAALARLEPGIVLGGKRGMHAATCLKCQAEAARYRTLQRSCRELAAALVPAPPGFEDSVGRAIQLQPQVGAAGSRLPGVAAAGAAAVVAAGTVAVLRRLRGVA